MAEFTKWRRFDLTKRLEKIRKAFRREAVWSAEDVPVVVNTPCYYTFGNQDKPYDYFTNPASMLTYQTEGYEKHLRAVQDDLVPYFMPWLGTGVLASGFGAQIRMPDHPSDDPAVGEPILHTPADVAKLKLPDPNCDGWMPRVLEIIDYAVEHGDLPVGLTDMQGPLDTLGQLCGQGQLYLWMYDEPHMVHELFDLVTEAFIRWVKVQKEHIGEPLERSNGLQGTYSPGCGVWESDDDLVLINRDLYAEFVAPCVGRIFEAFRGGSLHYCGKGTQHLDTFRRIPYLKVINNSPLGKYEVFSRLVKEFSGKVMFQVQDAAPQNPEEYYDRLFEGVEDFRGLMVVTFVLDNTAMDELGGYLSVDWNPFETANRVVSSVRTAIAKRLG
jgi:uroporphyrinogen-III decarboxylase